jgi:hypothetical protein
MPLLFPQIDQSLSVTGSCLLLGTFAQNLPEFRLDRSVFVEGPQADVAIRLFAGEVVHMLEAVKDTCQCQGKQALGLLPSLLDDSCCWVCVCLCVSLQAWTLTRSG